MQRKIKRALISVSDKTGIEGLASFLSHKGVEIISTGGTAHLLKKHHIPVIDIAGYTGFPEMMDGRVKTLHPKIHGGILACRDDAGHQAAMKAHNIADIDMVIVNLYPFEEQLLAEKDDEIIIENIDIGGPAMLRSAAKNHAYVTVVCDKDDYGIIQQEMEVHNQAISVALRRKLAGKAFAHTAYYDAMISQWFAGQYATERFPRQVTIAAVQKQPLRYGENPHQGAGFYAFPGMPQGLVAAKQIQGKELSYNNIHDSDAALALVKEFSGPAVAIIKHANPCGVALDKTIEAAFEKALACDPTSAFGGIFAFNRPLTPELAGKLAAMFIEVILVPSISEEVATVFSSKKNLRILCLDTKVPAQPHKGLQIKTIVGGLLLQEPDHCMVDRNALAVVSKVKPTEKEMEELLFAFTVCKHVRSNAIVLTADKATIGIGAGQMSRVDASRIAAQKAASFMGGKVVSKKICLASDAFFPFADGVEEAAKVGVKAIIQPGGSVRDEEVVKAADDHGIAMVFTGIRHFKH